MSMMKSDSGTAPPSTMPTPSSSSSAHLGGASSQERTRYFPRKLLTADDLTADQQHVLAKLRRHNRYLHGWGVVCGAGVRAVPCQKYTVVVEPGYLLGPQGDEILIDQCVHVDLSRQGLDGNAASPCVPPIDPWCASTPVDLRIGQRLFIAAAYTECLSRPVRVQPAGCGCDEASCEYSRIRDGYVIRVLTSLPDSYSKMKPPVKPWLCPKGGVRDCPECIADPWVLLAAVTIRGDVISDKDIDNVTYRRHVISFADDYLLCGPKLIALVLNPDVVAAGNPSEGTVTLDRPAPQGDSYILLANSDPTSATAPDHVTVPATHTSAPFSIATTAVGPGGDVTFSATLLGDTKSAVLSILTLKSLTISPPSGQVGATYTGTVTLSTPAPANTAITISSDSPAVASAPASVTIATGSTSQTFDITTYSQSPGGLVTFTASLGATQRTATLSLYSLTDLTVPPKAIAGQAVQGTVQLAGTVPAAGVTVHLQSDNPGFVSVPDAVTVPSGTNPSVSFPIDANRGGMATVTATLGTQSSAASIEVIGLKEFYFTDDAGYTVNEVYVGLSLNGHLELTAPVPGGMAATVILETAEVGYVDIPGSVVIDSPSTSETFRLTANKLAIESLGISAKLGGDVIEQYLRIYGPVV